MNKEIKKIGLFKDRKDRIIPPKLDQIIIPKNMQLIVNNSNFIIFVDNETGNIYSAERELSDATTYLKLLN